MSENRTVAIGATLLGLLAIAVTAGIYSERTGGNGQGGSVPAGDATGAVDQVGIAPWIVENSIAVFLVLSVVVLVVLGVAVLTVHGRDGLRMIARFLAWNAVAALLAALLFFGGKALLVFFADGPAEVPGSGSPSSGEAPPGAVGGDPGATGGGAADPYLLLGAFVLAIVIGTLLFRRRGGTSAATTAADSAPPPRTATADGNESRIDVEDVPATNAVYRSWRDMATAALDSGDRTATTGEVARAARRAGFDGDAVETLTRLFEEVRYGDRPVTEERERRATAALGRIDGLGGER